MKEKINGICKYNNALTKEQLEEYERRKTLRSLLALKEKEAIEKGEPFDYQKAWDSLLGSQSQSTNSTKSTSRLTKILDLMKSLIKPLQSPRD